MPGFIGIGILVANESRDKSTEVQVENYLFEDGDNYIFEDGDNYIFE